MLPFLRAPFPPRTNRASENSITYEDGASSLILHAPGSDYVMTNTLPPRGSLPDEPSVIQPPFHYHIYQSERFRAARGTGNFYIGLDTTPTHVLTAGSEKSAAGIPPGRYHRFENASTTEPFTVDIALDPEAYENEQRFFRNFFGYLDDCKKNRTAPSLLQLMVFLHSADTPLALPVPHPALERNVGIWASRVVMVVLAGVGGLMGYRASYGEYYEEAKGR